MPNYENETCAGCLHREDDTCGCVENWIDSPNVSGEPLRPGVVDDSESCPDFTPSLECRKVRALESIAIRGVRQWRGCKWGIETPCIGDCPVFDALPNGCHDCEYWGGYE